MTERLRTVQATALKDLNRNGLLVTGSVLPMGVACHASEKVLVSTFSSGGPRGNVPYMTFV